MKATKEYAAPPPPRLTSNDFGGSRPRNRRQRTTSCLLALVNLQAIDLKVQPSGTFSFDCAFNSISISSRLMLHLVFLQGLASFCSIGCSWHLSKEESASPPSLFLVLHELDRMKLPDISGSSILGWLQCYPLLHEPTVTILLDDVPSLMLLSNCIRTSRVCPKPEVGVESGNGKAHKKQNGDGRLSDLKLQSQSLVGNIVPDDRVRSNVIGKRKSTKIRTIISYYSRLAPASPASGYLSCEIPAPARTLLGPSLPTNLSRYR